MQVQPPQVKREQVTIKEAQQIPKRIINTRYKIRTLVPKESSRRVIMRESVIVANIEPL